MKDTALPPASESFSTPAHFSKIFAICLLGVLLSMTAAATWYTRQTHHIPETFLTWLPWVILFIGILISFLIFIVLYNLSSSQIHGEALARQMTKHLRESEERFRQLAENIDEVFWLSDPLTGEMLYVSKAYEKIWGQSVQSVYFKPKSFLESVHTEDSARVQKLLNAEETKTSFDMEYRIIRPDSTIRWIRNRSFPIRNAGGEIYRVAGVAQDITEKMKTEAQLLQSQKMETVGTLAGGVAHDLNNQLTPVRGYLDMVLKELPADHPVQPLLKEANMSAARCAEIIHRLLTYSRPSSHHKKPLALERLFKEIQDLLTKVLPSTIEIVVSCPPGIWVVEGNETELQTVLMNLATNARDALREGGRFTMQAANITLERPQVKNDLVDLHYVLVTVQDTGMGIPSENLHRIFEPFFSTKEKGRGTGLGLAMVFKIIQDHGGWIEVSSILGKGTTFQIYLPAKINHEVVQMPKIESPLSHVMGNGETVLFADDEEAIRNLGRVFLEKLNYKAVLAVDGEDALSTYQKSVSTINVVLMDMTMPKMTGKQTLEKILSVNPKAKVVIMSGYTAEGLPEELITSGAASFLQKPYTLVSLGDVLKKVLSS